MATPNHFMRGNRSCSIPQQIVVLATVPISLGTPPEKDYYADVHAATAVVHWRTRNGKPTGRDFAVFNRACDLWNYLDLLLSPSRTTWVFAHRLGTAIQLLGFWDRVDRREVDITSTTRTATGAHTDARPKQQNAILCTDDPPTIIKWYRPGDQATVTMVDTRNYWPSWSPRGMADTEPNHDGADPRLDNARYARQLALARAQSVEETLCRYLDWIAVHDLGMFRYTIAGQAHAAFRHRFKSHEILVHQNLDARSIERAGYYGGQTEVYRLGRLDGPLYKVDINALYPWVMANYDLPTKIEEYRRDDNRGYRLPSLVPLDKAIFTVTLDTDRETFPVRSDNHVQYVTGYYKTTLCGPELVRAYTNGNIVEWHGYTYYETQPLLRDFATTLWTMRRAALDNGSQLEAKWCKLLANSLYGKFGQLLPEWNELIGKTGFPPWGKSYVCFPDRQQIKTLRTVAGQLFELSARQEHPEAVPSIAAFITAHARERMRQLRLTAGTENCVYQVTDCLLVNQSGYDRLTTAEPFDAGRLGALRLVDTYDAAEIFGVNCYKLDDSWVTAGISQRVISRGGRCVKILTEERINGTLERKPLDTHFTKIRHATMRYRNIIERTNADGFVTPPNRDERPYSAR